MSTPSDSPREGQSHARDEERAPESRTADGSGGETLAEKIRRYSRSGPGGRDGHASPGGPDRERSRDPDG